MPASPVTAKTGSSKIKAVGQTGGSHFGTDDTRKQVGRAQATRQQTLGK